MSLQRHGARGTSLVEDLRERDHSVTVRDCLDRCGVCQMGRLIVSLDGMTTAVPDPAALLSAVDAATG